MKNKSYSTPRRFINKTVLIICLLILSVVCIFVGCTKEQKSNNKQDDFMGATKWSFESQEEIYKCFRFMTSFGRVSLNSEKKFVTDGDHSLKVEPLGTYNPSLGDPYIVIRLNDLSETKVYDLSAIKEVQMDLFNQNEEDKVLSVAFVADGRTTNYEEFTVKAGENKNITVPVNVRAMQLTTDMTKTTEMYITFPAAELEQPADLYYLDNLRLNFYDKAPAPYEMERDKDEICSFDKEYQQYIVIPGAIGPATGCMPYLEMNEQAEYAKGGKSLKATYPTGTIPLDDGWPNWAFTEGFMESIDFKSYADKEAEIVFDVYVPEESGRLQFEAQFKYAPVTDDMGNTVTVRGGIHYFTPTPGQWTEVRVPVTTWSKFYDENGKEIGTHVRGIAMSICKFADPDKVFYFDNFRFYVPDTRDTAGMEDFSKDTTDKVISAGWETFVEYGQGKAVSSSGAKPEFYGKFTGGDARDKWVLCARNNDSTNDLYYEVGSDIFAFVGEGDTITMDVWAYVWKWDDNRINQCINKNWELEFYEYRADGKYETAKPAFSYLLGHCGSPKWKTVEIPADVTYKLKETGKFAFRINQHVENGCYEHELFIDFLKVNKGDAIVETGTDLAAHISARLANCDISIGTVLKDGVAVTLENGIVTETGVYTVTVTAESEKYAPNTFTLIYTVTEKDELFFEVPEQMDVEVGDTFTLSDVKGIYNGKEITPEIDVKFGGETVTLEDNTFRAEKVGEYTINYTFTYGNSQTKTYTQKIVSVDTTKPVVEFGKEMYAKYPYGKEIVVSAKVTDASSDSLVAEITVKDGAGNPITLTDNKFTPTSDKYVITATAKDASGNTETITKTVYVAKEGEVESFDNKEYVESWFKSERGIVTYNEDAKYKRGETGGSIKLTLQKQHNNTTLFINDWLGEDYKDIQSLSFWVYNPTEYDFGLCMSSGLWEEGNSEGRQPGTIKYLIHEQRCKAGEWTQITIEKSLINRITDSPLKFYFNGGSDLNMVIPNISQVMALYFDDFTYTKA